EELLRIYPPLVGVISPERFNPLAEDCGLNLPLGDWVLEHACQQMGECQKLHAPFGPLSVNHAGAQLGQPQLIERLEQL
ncbi:EAL domain-containing protein, partial [Pseudomonas aeruginosa]|uniref:EAL domain-containing protein n=1 Tax=Pseudomonas aeruginosa TaxID=287 RepID=UPI003CC54A2E